MIWTTWWAWLAGALILGILEVLAPGVIFLGFACGAALVGLLFAIGPVGDWLATSFPMTMVIFALASLASWVILRQVMGKRQNQPKIIENDIND
ncbi:NfeD family protein [Halocynthiibacter styelae]|uniref:NfeD family protein n=1 Tax=Halocynthiibacter styelae TaxID=2761955 RepID=A0A8J7J5I9_9RHOB|nr:hypothetical protein [Paenihalocynthiibacter styelae]MBI1493815.1 hypothetical protein [Paenihalocynthiibacter styelae]